MYACVRTKVRKEQKVHVQLNNVTDRTDLLEVHVTQLVVLVTFVMPMTEKSCSCASYYTLGK